VNEKREDWPPPDWVGELRIGMQIKNPATGRFTTYSTSYLHDATREDWDHVQAALIKLARERELDLRTEVTEEDEEVFEAGHSGPGTGHS
jgi:hypothetical protein